MWISMKMEGRIRISIKTMANHNSNFNEEYSQKHFNVKILLPSAIKIVRVTCEGETTKIF